MLKKLPNLVFFREPNYVCIEKWLAPAASAKTFLGNNDGNVKPIKLFHNINDEYCHKSKHIFYGFWAAAPKGMKSCRTQGDFCSFVCPFVCSFVRASPPGPLRPEICPLRPKICPLRPGICSLRPWICPLRPEICTLRPEICPLRPKISPLRPETCPLGP